MFDYEHLDRSKSSECHTIENNVINVNTGIKKRNHYKLTLAEDKSPKEKYIIRKSVVSDSGTRDFFIFRHVIIQR